MVAEWYNAHLHLPYPKLPAGSYAIYALCDPFTGEVRYVGATKRWPIARYIEHLRAANPEGRQTVTSSWISELYTQGLCPELRILEVTTEWVEAEKRWIANFSNLLNDSPGGPGLQRPHTEEVKRKISSANKGNRNLGAPGVPKTAEHRAKISAAMRAK